MGLWYVHRSRGVSYSQCFVRLDKGEVTALKSLLCALDSVLAALGGAKGGPMWKCEKGHTDVTQNFPWLSVNLGMGNCSCAGEGKTVRLCEGQRKVSSLVVWNYEINLNFIFAVHFFKI